MAMYQVEMALEKRHAVADIEEAREATAALFGEARDVEAEDAEYGLWLVDLPREVADDLEEIGMLDLHRGGFSLWAEIS